MKDVDAESEDLSSDGDTKRAYIDDLLADSKAGRNDSLSPIVVFGLLVGVVLFFWGYRLSYSADETTYQSIKAQAFASKKWPSVPGTITKSRFIYHPDLPGRGSHPYYTLEITYDYAVAGGRFTDSQISFPNPKLSDEQECEPYLSRFPAGSTVKVYYDPTNAKTSCLMNGVTKSLRSNIHWREEYLTKPEPDDANQ